MRNEGEDEFIWADLDTVDCVFNVIRTEHCINRYILMSMTLEYAFENGLSLMKHSFLLSYIIYLKNSGGNLSVGD